MEPGSPSGSTLGHPSPEGRRSSEAASPPQPGCRLASALSLLPSPPLTLFGSDGRVDSMSGLRTPKRRAICGRLAEWARQVRIFTAQVPAVAILWRWRVLTDAVVMDYAWSQAGAERRARRVIGGDILRWNATTIERMTDGAPLASTPGAPG